MSTGFFADEDDAAPDEDGDPNDDAADNPFEQHGLEGFAACASCHVDGRSDNVSWRLSASAALAGRELSLRGERSLYCLAAP